MNGPKVIKMMLASIGRDGLKPTTLYYENDKVRLGGINILFPLSFWKKNYFIF